MHNDQDNNYFAVGSGPSGPSSRPHNLLYVDTANYSLLDWMPIEDSGNFFYSL
jgi:hypothetical protein